MWSKRWVSAVIVQKKDSAIGQAAYSTLDQLGCQGRDVQPRVPNPSLDYVYVCLYGEFVYGTCIYDKEKVRLNTFR
jgi:hypothetical protein